MKKDKIVYMLVDENNPGAGIFYIGQGNKDRIFDHKKEADKKPRVIDNSKIGIINSIGTKLRLVVIRSGLDEKTAKEIEAALIDVFNSSYVKLAHSLTNTQIGHGSKSKGLRTIGVVSCKNNWAKLEITENIIGIKATTNELMSKSFDEIVHATHSIDTTTANKCDLVVLEKEDGHIIAVYECNNKWTSVPSVVANKPLSKFSGVEILDPCILKRLLGCRIPRRKQKCPAVRILKKEYIDNAKKVERKKQK